MKTTTLDTAAPLPVRGPVRLRRVFEWLLSAGVACFGAYLMLE